MKLQDFSPTDSPTQNQQRDALRKGLGRAVQWARAGRLEDDLLLQACQHDWRFDWQIDGLRAPWLWNLMQLLDVVEQFRDPILHAVTSLPEYDAYQLCDLSYRYAEAGDNAFREQLYRIVRDEPFSHMPWLGMEHIIQLDGEQGFLFAARARARHAKRNDDDADWWQLFATAMDYLDDARISELLDSTTNEELQDCRAGWVDFLKSRKSERKGRSAYEQRVRAIPVDQILEIIDRDSRRQGLLRGWGRYASENDLTTILSRLENSEDPGILERTLRVFARRAIPRFERFIKLCGHENEQVRDRAFTALANNIHPRIREFAIEQLTRCANFDAIELLEKNFESGDEGRILNAFHPPDDENHLHWFLLTILNVLEANPEAKRHDLALIAYGLTPCEACRLLAVELLRQQKAIPDWMREECRDDSDVDCRELVREP